MPDTPPTLAALQAACWQQLERACRERGHGWRLLALATRAGDAADARMVVLRDVAPQARELLFYTDSRSPKVAQAQAQPLGTLLAWCPMLGWQLRLAVRLEVHTDGLEVSSRWARLKLQPAAQDYMSSRPPGSPLAGKTEPPRATREHFAVVTAKVLAMDWLALQTDGHRRARFDERGARWLQP